MSQQPGLVPTFIVLFLTLNYPTGDAPGLAAPAEHVDDLIGLLAEGFLGRFDDS